MRPIITILGFLFVLMSTLPTHAQEASWTVSRVSNLDVYSGHTFNLHAPNLPAYFDGQVTVRIHGLDVPSYQSRCRTANQQRRELNYAWAGRKMLAYLLMSARTITVTYTGTQVAEGPEHMRSYLPLVHVYVDGTDVKTLMTASGYSTLETSATDWCDL